tara:strand:- start:103 stop:213 length:111 start_codon:yes stop_codon:yes gene_type:complete
MIPPHIFFSHVEYILISQSINTQAQNGELQIEKGSN